MAVAYLAARLTHTGYIRSAGFYAAAAPTLQCCALGIDKLRQPFMRSERLIRRRDTFSNHAFEISRKQCEVWQPSPLLLCSLTPSTIAA